MRQVLLMDKISHDKAPRYRRLLTPNWVDMLSQNAQRAKFSPPFVPPGWKAIDYRRCTTGMTAARVSNAAVIDPAPACDVPRASRLPKGSLVVLGQLVKRVVQLSLEVEKCEMQARADRVSLHFSLHGHLLPHHHLFLHHHFLLSHALTLCRESAGVGTLRRRRLARFGSPDIGIGRSDVQPGTSRRGRQKNNCNQEKLAHRRLHLMMATVSPIQA